MRLGNPETDIRTCDCLDDENLGFQISRGKVIRKHASGVSSKMCGEDGQRESE